MSGLALLTAALLWPGAAEAGIRKVTLQVHGMTCPLCTRGVEESIRTLGGISAVTTDLASGEVSVEAAEGKSLVLSQVRQRIEKAGFRVQGEPRLLASARFTLGPEGRITLRIPGTPHAWQVLEESGLRRLIREHPGLKGEFVVDLRVHDHPSWKPAAVSILSFEALPAPAAPAAGR